MVELDAGREMGLCLSPTRERALNQWRVVQRSDYSCRRRYSSNEVYKVRLVVNNRLLVGLNFGLMATVARRLSVDL